jgi:hypothetical protein
MGLLNNNNNRRNKRANLRKDGTLSSGSLGYQPGTFSTQASLGSSTSLLGSGNAFQNSQPNLSLNVDPLNTANPSASTGVSGGGGNMMGYMQLAAAATPMVMGFIQNRKQKGIAEDLETARLAKEKDVQKLMANRAEIRNPYANLAVATEAAEFQAQQADQSLANTLDAMQAGGFGAGGATALAREASKSKQGISADIQKQEATNQKFFAQGEQIRQQAQIDKELDTINYEIGNLDRLDQKEIDARTAQQAAGQAGVSGSAQMMQSVMKNPEAMKAIGGIFGK